MKHRDKFRWYGLVVKIIRNYPEMKLAKEAMRSVSHSDDGIHTQASRTTENIALRMLSEREEQDLDAVEQAIEDIGRSRDGGEILRIVDAVDWQGYKLNLIADKMYMHRNTAARLRRKFIYAVARNLGYLK